MSVPMDFTSLGDISSDDDSSDDSGSEGEDSNDVTPQQVEGKETEDPASDIESDDDDVDEEALKIEIVGLEKALKENPYHYDSHAGLIQVYKKAGDFSSLQTARQKMADLFPLTELLWLEWILDERRMETGREAIQSLLEKAVRDYFSVQLWVEWCTFMIGLGDVDQTRVTFEKALSVVGLHVSMGSLIWEAYREYEMAQLAMLQPAPGSVSSADEQKKLDVQTMKVLKLFERQLGIPHFEMDATMSEYEQWIGKEAVTEVLKRSYIEAKKRLTELQKLEDALEEAEAPKLVAYKNYIKYELSKESPARVQLIYERALVDNCLNQELWEEYGTYLDRVLKIPSKSLSVYERASRNCPWSSNLWRHWLEVAEKNEEPKGSVDAIYEKALGAGFASVGDFGQICLTYLDYLRRQCGKIEKDETGKALQSTKLELLRAGFMQAIEFLSTLAFEDNYNQIARVAQYWARFEARHCSNMEEARKIWTEQIFPLGYHINYNMQMEFINLERAYGSIKHCRRHFHKALNSTQMDYPDALFDAYIVFEREEGSLDDYFQSISFVDKQKNILQQREAKKADKESNAPDKGRKTAEKRPMSDGSRNGPPTKKKKQEVVKLNEPNKQTNLNGLNTSKVDNEGFKVPKLPGPSSKPLLGQNSKPSCPNPTASPKIQQEKPKLKAQSLEVVDEALEKRDRTVFISNLDFAAGDEDVKEAFKFCGPVVDIRLVTDARGKPRGFGYVEFAEPKGAEAALKMDRYLVKDRPLYISKVKEKGAKTEKKFQYTTGLEPRKLFIKNLPLVSDKAAVQNMFKEHGQIVNVRIVTHKSGKSKGLAYVEYGSEEQAKNAMLKTDGMVVGENTIEVSISNTPQRKLEVEKKEVASPDIPVAPVSAAPHLGGGKKETTDRGKVRTQVSLVPRSAAMLIPRSLTKSKVASKPEIVAKAVPKENEQMDIDKTVDASTSATADEKTEVKKSNDDFRKMFLN